MANDDLIKKEQDKINAASKEITKNNKLEVNPYETGKDFAYFDAGAANLPKYASYGSEIYGKLGFNPLLLAKAPGQNKTKLDALYDTSTSYTADLDRARIGAWKLAKIGFQDTFAQGLFAANDNYLDFESVMNKYSSSRGGVTQTTANAFLSAGYTWGIITGIAAEELVIGGVTALTGFTSAPVTGGLAASTLGRGVNKLIKGLDALSDIKAARTWVGRTAMYGAKKLNPLEGTMDLFRNLDNLKDLNNWKQAALGAGAVVRDARKITMSHGESKLEANLAQKEFRDTQFEFFKKENAKLGLGETVTDEQLRKIDSEAKKVYDNVYQGNFGLIYATNAITFDNMFKNMKATNFLAKDLYSVLRKKGSDLVSVEVLKNTVWNTVRNQVGKLTWKSALDFSLSSSMEGFQEVGQDWISGSVQSYRARNVQGKQLRGGFFTYLEQDLKDAAYKSYKDGSGLEAYLSGALMGVFAGPVGFATGRVNNYLFNGGINKTYQFVANNEAYQKQKLKLEEQRIKKAQNLTNFFNESGTFLQTIGKTVYTQEELQEGLIAAANNNDKRTFNTKQNESFVKGVHDLMESGLDSEFAKHLTYMADKFSVEELQEMFGRKDINEDNASEYREKIKKRANQVTQLRKEYDEIQLNNKNPYNLNDQTSDDPEAFINNVIKYTAFEDFKKELLFNRAAIENRAERLKDIEEEIRNETALSSTEVAAFMSTSALDQQIRLLETEYNAAKELKGADKTAVFKKLSAFKSYKEALVAYKNLQAQKVVTVSEKEEFDKLFDAYMEVMSAYGEKMPLDYSNLDVYNSKLELFERSFQKIYDYQNLGLESDYLNEYADILNSTVGADKWREARAELLKNLEGNKEQYIKDALEEFDKRQVSDEMLTKLKEAGLFFDLAELDDLMKNGIMPSEIYNLATDEIVPATTEEYNTAVDIIKSYYEKLTGKKIKGSAKQKFGRKYKSDKRTLSRLLIDYSIKMGGVVDLSSKKGRAFIDKLLSSSQITTIDKEILLAIKDSNAKIKFVNNNPLPVTVNNGVYELDLRYAASDYEGASFSFENLVLTALVQNQVFENLKTNDDLFHTARRAMEQAKAEFLKQYPGADISQIGAFSKVEVFLSEALNDPSLQQILAKIKDELQPTKMSLLGTVKDVVQTISTDNTKFENLDDTLLNRVINIAIKATDSTVTDAVSESDEKISEAEKRREQLEKEKVDALQKQATALGKRWNVNVQVVANQREAQQIISKKKSPFQQRFGEILNNLMYPPVQGLDLRKNITPAEVKLLELIQAIYNKSESVSELISNLKDLAAYKTNNNLVELVEFISENADNVLDTIEVAKNLFFQTTEEQTAGFYDEETNTAYIVADAVRDTTMYHEIFLHPYLINLEKQNPELYRKLVREARADNEIVDYVTKTYGSEETIGSRQFEHEIVGRAFDLNVNGQLEKPNRIGLFASIKEFSKNLLNKVLQFLGINTLNRKIFNENSTTIKDLAQYVVKGNEDVDLGKVIEIDQELNAEIPQTNAPDNYTASEAFEEEEESQPLSFDEDESEKLRAVNLDEYEDEEPQEPSSTARKSINDIQNKISELENQIALKKKEMESKAGILNSIKRNRLNAEITKLSQEVNDLYDTIEEIKEQYQLEESEYVQEVDDLGIPLINHLTPWDQINEQLKEELAELYGVPVNKLTELDIVKIKENMFENPNYISIINDNYQVQYNRKAAIKNKELQQEAIKKEKEERKQLKKPKSTQTNEEIIRGIIGKNISYFSEQDVKIMAELLKSKENTAADIRDLAFAKAQEKVKQDIQKQFEIEDKIQTNFELLNAKNLIYNKKRRLRISNKFIRFLTTYHPQIFSKEHSDFVAKVKEILMNRSSATKQQAIYRDVLKELSDALPSDYETIVNKKLLELEQLGTAYPESIKQINDALYDSQANIKIVQIYRSKKNKTGQASTNYYIQNRNWKPKTKQAKRGLSAKLDFLFSDEFMAALPDIYILNQLLTMEVKMSAILADYGLGEVNSWKSGTKKLKIKDDRNSYGERNQNYNMGSLADDIYPQATDEQKQYVADFFKKYSNLDNAINSLFDQVTNFGTSNDELNEEDPIGKDEKESMLAFIEFMNSEEGQKYQEEEIKMRSLFEKEEVVEIQKETAGEEVSELEKEKNSLLETLKKIQELMPRTGIKKTKYTLTTTKQINKAIQKELNALNAEMQTTFPDIVKLIKFYNEVSLKVPETVINNFFELAKGHKELVAVEVDGRFMYFEEIGDELFLLDDTTSPMLVTKENLTQITNVIVEEVTVNDKKTDTSLNQANEKIIIQSYADVFNNFVSLKADLNSLTLDQAIEQFKLETSKCK